MPSRSGALRAGLGVIVSLLTVLVAAACGSSSSSSESAAAQALLVKTFTGNHTVKSGVLNFSLALAPSGSSSATGPIGVSLSGPFESSGSGKLPESDLNIGLNALGRHGRLEIISTGGSGYVTLDQNAYRLPAGDVQKIAGEVSRPTVDVWTGTSDSTLRKLSLTLSFPVSGELSALLGGTTSAAFGMTLQYSDLNQPQTISAPAGPQSFNAFETKLRGIVQRLGGGLLGSGALGSLVSGTTNSSGGA